VDDKIPQIPHAKSVFIRREPPRVILHVVTDLAEHQTSPEFKAEANHELMQAVGRTQGGQAGFDGYVVHWSDGDRR